MAFDDSDDGTDPERETANLMLRAFWSGAVFGAEDFFDDPDEPSFQAQMFDAFRAEFPELALLADPPDDVNPGVQIRAIRDGEEFAGAEFPADEWESAMAHLMAAAVMRMGDCETTIERNDGAGWFSVAVLTAPSVSGRAQ